MDDGASPKINNAEKNKWFSEFWKKLSRKNPERVTEGLFPWCRKGIRKVCFRQAKRK